MKICLDAGHSKGQNQSPVDGRYFEGERMFRLQELLKRELEDYGVQVVCTREKVEDNPSLYRRARMAEGCQVLLSLHSNAVGDSRGNETVDHVTVYYPVSGKRKDLALELSRNIGALMGTRQESKIAQRYNSAGNADYYGVIRHAAEIEVPCLLLEHSFHTHTRSTQWLLEDENLYALARLEAAKIGEYFGLEVPEVRYEKLKDIQSPYYRPTVEKLLEKGVLQGKGGSGEETVIDLGEDAIRLLVVLDRTGVFD